MLSFLPAVTAQTSIRIVPYINPIIGVNSPTSITWEPIPNILQQEPYTNQVYVWPNATITFTKPDGTTQVLNGPFESTFPPVGNTEIRDIRLIYTPDMEGVWQVNFTWPGDSKYNAVSRVDSFLVGDHFEKRQTFAMLSLRPYPEIGIGQSMLVNAWITPPPQTAREYYENYSFTIRKPDNSIYLQFEVPITETPGTTWFDFPVDQLGNWTIQFDYPGNWYNLPSSVTRSFIVQQEPIPQGATEAPLPPTQAWTFPVNAFNREWRNIAGPWYQQNYNASGIGWNEFTEAPKSAHIKWKLDPISGVGGLIGTHEDSPGITTSNMYSHSSPNIRTVMAGRGYYTGGGMIYCIDMQTGEQLWSVPGSFNAGATRNRTPVLFSMGTRFIEYNAITGQVTRNLTGIPPIPPNPNPDVPLSSSYTGELFFDYPYFYQTFSGWYNDTKGDWDDGFVVKYDTNTGRIVWNATFAAGPLTSAYTTIHNNLMICRSFKVGTIIVQYMKALNLTTGQLEYSTPIMDKADPDSWVYRQGPALGSAYGLVYYAGTAYEDGPFAYFAFDASTGQHKWVTRFSDEDYPWANFFAYMPQTAGYGQIFVLSYAGVYGINATNGEIIWKYSAGNSGMETPYNTWPFGSTGAVVGGGVVFAPSTEHSPTLYYRGTRIHAIDAFTGEGIWNISGYYTPTAVAYGTLIATDVPNGGTYGFGKGSTETTVFTSSKVSAKGTPILIEGTVTDQSTAQKGTPAISDEDMTAWMEYLHMQMPKPTDATGVPVKLTAVDSAGNTIDIGTTTSDDSGAFGIMWTPPEEGKYTIIAAFEGSNSYYGSSASTIIGVGPAQAGTSPQPTTPTSPTTSPATSPTAPASPTAPTTSPAPASPTPAPEPGSDITLATYAAIAAAAIIAAVIAAAIILKKRTK